MRSSLSSCCQSTDSVFTTGSQVSAQSSNLRNLSTVVYKQSSSRSSSNSSSTFSSIITSGEPNRHFWKQCLAVFSLNSLNAAGTQLITFRMATFSIISYAFQCLLKSNTTDSKSTQQFCILMLEVFDYPSSITRLQPAYDILGKKLEPCVF